MISTFTSLPSSTTLRATLRKMEEISLSKLRTPASRVYRRTTSVKAPSVNEMFLGFKPCDSVCFEMRCLFAISTFSCSV